METTMNTWTILQHYGLNMIITFIFIVLIYNRYRRQEQGLIFTYFMFNTIVFFVSFMLSAITLSIGFAFGLFAIFGILRYRTEPIPIREMTYLFGAITLGLINGLAPSNFILSIIVVPNIAIVVLAFLLEFFLAKHALLDKLIIYEKIENIKPENREALLADLKERTGLDIVNIEIYRVDFLRDTARIRIFFREDSSSG